MKLAHILVIAMATVASGLPQGPSPYRRVARSGSPRYQRDQDIAPRFPYNPLNYVRTKQDERVHGEQGAYTFDIETENDIVLSEAGQSKGQDIIVKAGSYAFVLPDGNAFELKYVADENGFQPESAYLPVAPVFPHAIPEFVLEQIRKAELEDAEALRNGQELDDGSYKPYRY